jgi:hypothetical protein
MPQPFNYSLNVQDPAQSMLQALKFRGSLQDAELRQQAGSQNQMIRDQQIEQNRMKLDQDKINFDQQTEQYRMKLEQQRVQQSASENEALQNDLFQTESLKFHELPKEQQTQEERARILRLLPGGMKKQMQDRYNSLPKEQAAQLQSDSGRFYAGLSGNKQSQDITMKNMEELADIYEADARPENDGYAASLRGMVERGPESALLQIGAGLGAMPKGLDIIKAVDGAKISRQKTAQAKVDLASKEASTARSEAQSTADLALKEVSTAIKNVELQLAESKKSGTLDIDKKFIYEEKLRKEFKSRTKLYDELTPAFNNIKSSAASKSGAGDIAMITSFMKMLDPGSVVRETEFATARNTAGLLDRLLNNLSNLKDGTLISLKSNQRQQYVALAKQYLTSAKKQAVREKASIGIVSRNYGLNDENVFGVFGQEEQPEDNQQPTTGKLTQPSTGELTQPSTVNRNIVVDF